MKNLRTYGKSPFTVAVVHGGPGAPGEMAPVARELSAYTGVLEPLQTATTLDGQVAELKQVLEDSGDLPVTLVGFSWGAMLSFIFTSRHPMLVRKLILVASAVFEDRYAADIMETRLSRLSETEREEAFELMVSLEDPAVADKDRPMARLGELMAQADACDPLPHDSEVIAVQHSVFQGVWEQAAALRSSGRLLELGKRIRCPVVAIHGDRDPHPPEGVREPLSRVLSDFRFILLERCGHRPWIERSARDEFYGILRREINEAGRER
jgi:pimeloyl-ACP methyl ester carboxylesterase